MRKKQLQFLLKESEVARLRLVAEIGRLERVVNALNAEAAALQQVKKDALDENARLREERDEWHERAGHAAEREDRLREEGGQ